MQLFFVLKNAIFFGIYLLVMAKYWGEQIFTHGNFPEVGQKQRTEKKNLTIVLTMASYVSQMPPRVAHAKPPGTEKRGGKERPKVGNNNGQLRIAMPPRVVHAKLPGPIILEPYNFD